MNSLSPGTFAKRPSFQSALAFSMRSSDDDTKFHHMWRGPSSGAPPSSISLAARLGSPRLPGCTLVVTLEPCAMCAAAAAAFRVGRVMFGAYDPKGGGIEHGARVYETQGALHRPEVIGGIRETDAAGLLRDFFKRLR